MAIGRITGPMLSANLARSGTDLTFETNLLALDVTNSRVGVGTASPATTLHVSATDALRLPSGTTGQRPGSPANGDVRYNSTTSAIEGYVGSAFVKLSGGTSLEDADGDTSVEVERTSDADSIHFMVANADAMHIRSNATVEVNNLKIDDQTITGLGTNANIEITPQGSGKTQITNLLVAGSADFGDLNALNVGDINVDTVSSDDGNGFDLVLDDNKANALEIKEGSNTYINFATSDGSELITISKATTINGVAFTANTVDINGGAIDGTAIGANSATTGVFTTATATNVQATNLKANDGTAAIAIADSTGAVTVSTNLEVSGNLTVNGTTTTIDSTTLTVEDPLIQLAKNNSGGAANTFDQGLFFNRGSDDNVSFIWDESADQFAVAVTASEDGTTAGNVTIDSYAAFKAGVTTVSDLETGSISAADGTAAATIANSTGIITFSAAPSFGDNNITNVGDIALDSISADDSDIDITLTDNSATALEIKEGSNAYMTFSTANSAEVITSNQSFTVASGKTLTATTAQVNGDITVNGSVVADTITTAGSNANIAITPQGTGEVDISKVDIDSGAIDGTAIGANSASTGAFTTLSATGNTNINGGNFIFNEDSASVDARFESNGDTHALFVDGSEDHVGVRTSSPAYDLDVSGSTDALRLPNGTTGQRPTGATGIIRFNTTTGKYEGCSDGSTYIEFATAGSAPTFTKESTTGDGSTTTFAGFFSSAPESANNVFVYIDNVYQEPTENYTVSGTNITFTSAPHSAARIFAITGADNSSLVTGGVARSETSSVNFTSTATTIMSFNAATYRSAELFIQLQDTANTEYAAMKATVVHNGSTAFGTVYAVSNTGGEASDLATITFEHDGSSTVNVKAVTTGGQTAAKVQYSLVAA